VVGFRLLDAPRTRAPAPRHPAPRRRWARRVAAATAALSLVPATAAAADTIPAVGVNDLRSDGILLPNADYAGVADLDLLAGAGGRLYRGRMRLDCVDPQGTGTYDFGGTRPGCHGVSYDALIGELARRGITYLPVLMNFGTAAQPGDRPVPPTADGAGGTPTRAQFAAFAAAAARRYGPGGTFWASCGCAPQPIRAWEVWNEENNGWWWGGRASAEDYAAVFAETRAALRSADPQARAVVGGLTWDPNGESSFVAPDQVIAALAASNANAFDAVGVHPYTDARGQTSAQMAAAAQSSVDVAAQAVRTATGPAADGSPRQPIWVTELGWSDTDAAPDAVGGALRAFVAGLDGGSRASDNVGPVLWYMLRDGASKAVRDDQMGLRLTGPTGTDAGPKVVWSAFTEAASRGQQLALPPALADAPAYAPPPAPVPAASPVGGRGRVVAVRTRSARGRLTLLVTCVNAGVRCSGSVKLRAPLGVVARGRPPRRFRTVATGLWRAGGGQTATLAVPLNRAGAGALRRGGVLRVQVVVDARDSQGATAQVRARATLRAPGAGTG
jgi:hypothetical protein